MSDVFIIKPKTGKMDKFFSKEYLQPEDYSDYVLYKKCNEEDLSRVINNMVNDGDYSSEVRAFKEIPLHLSFSVTKSEDNTDEDYDMLKDALDKADKKKATKKK